MTYYTLLLFFLVEYVRPGNFVPGLDALKLNLLVPVTAIVGTFVRKSPVSNRDMLSEPNTMAMIVFLGLLCVSTLLATLTSNAFDVTKNVFAYMLIYTVLVRQLGSVDRIKGVFATLIGVHVIAIALSPNIFADSSGRASVAAGAFLGDGNDFALSVNIILPLCLFLLQESRKKLPKILWLSATLLLVMAIVATKSRGGTIALVIVGLYFWMKSRRKAATAACVLAAAAIVFIAAPPAYFNRMSTMTDTEESSAQGRITAWKTAGKMAAASPLLGAGAGHFPSAYGKWNGGRWMTAHSVYFLLLGELGIPGISVLFFLILYNLFANRRLQRALKQFEPDRTLTAANLLASTSAAVVAFAVAGAFLSAAYYPHLYVISGLAAAARHVVRQEIAALAQVGTSPQEQMSMAPVPVTHGVVSPTWRPRPAQAHRVGSARNLSAKTS
jgi:putative inorganic carbon (hco3(-)) transporter